MKNLIQRFKESIFYLPANNTEAYKKKIFESLAIISLLFSIVRLILINQYHNIPDTFLSHLVNALPLIVVIITLFVLKVNFMASKIIGLYFLPLAGTIISLIHNDNSIQYLLLIFLLISFIFFEKLGTITLCFIWNSLLYTTIQLNIFGFFSKNITFKESILVIADGSIFLLITFFLLTFLKNTVNIYMKRIEKDNDALIEVNADLIEMHKDLVKKNNILVKDRFTLDNNNKAIGKIISVISHDIKSPLISVKNIVNYTKDLKSNKENIVQYIPEISTTLNNTVGLLENLLEWARTQASYDDAKQEYINFNSIVKEVIDLYALPLKTKKIVLAIENPTNAFVSFNKPMLMTILRNLISNAVKFTKIEGQLKIVATPMHGKVKIKLMNEVDFIHQETIDKLNANTDVLQKGTAGEIGSGFGLHITRDFLNANHSVLQFTQKNNILVVCEFTIKGYINSKLKAISAQEEYSNYKLYVK